MTFKVGEEVTLVCKNRSVVLPYLFPNEPKTITYHGTIVQRTNWDEKDTIRISTGRQAPGVRVIPLEIIEEVNGQPFEFKKKVVEKKPEPRTVIVKGSSGKDYKITVYPDGNIHCTCPGFGFRRTCSHVDAFLAEEEKKC